MGSYVLQTKGSLRKVKSPTVFLNLLDLKQEFDQKFFYFYIFYN